MRLRFDQKRNEDLNYKNWDLTNKDRLTSKQYFSTTISSP
jgi:hypothetical protein